MPSEPTVYAENRGGMVVNATHGDHPLAMDNPQTGDDDGEIAVRRALALTEAQICPVWATVGPGTPAEVSLGLVEA